MKKNLEGHGFVEQAVQLARLYNLCCRWASGKNINILNILIMVEIYANKSGCEASQIADHLYLPRQTMTYAIDSLEKDGYIVRQNHPTDRRRKNIVLTELGTIFITDIMTEVEEEFYNFTSSFMPDRKQFDELFNNFVSHLEKKLDNME